MIVRIFFVISWVRYAFDTYQLHTQLSLLSNGMKLPVLMNNIHYGWRIHTLIALVRFDVCFIIFPKYSVSGGERSDSCFSPNSLCRHNISFSIRLEQMKIHLPLECHTQTHLSYSWRCKDHDWLPFIMIENVIRARVIAKESQHEIISLSI